MEDVILFIALIIMFVMGLFLMKRLDHFLEMNHKDIEMISRKPSCIILTEDITDEEILEEVHRFKKNKDSVRIFIYDGNDPTDPLDSNK